MEFEAFPKIARLKRTIIVSEKIDGTNAQIFYRPADDLGPEVFLVGSRNRWITPEDDNYGFARWAHDNRETLIADLGEGRHFGEWWGNGIQRRYDQAVKRFSLFNTHRWEGVEFTTPRLDVVPVLYTGEMCSTEGILDVLAEYGSIAAPGFMNPEGIVIYHQASKTLYKQTIEKDHEPKSLAA